MITFYRHFIFLDSYKDLSVWYRVNKCTDPSKLFLLGLKSRTLKRSHIDFIRNYGMILKLERFSHLLGRSFGLGSRAWVPMRPPFPMPLCLF